MEGGRNENEVFFLKNKPKKNPKPKLLITVQLSFVESLYCNFNTKKLTYPLNWKDHVKKSIKSSVLVEIVRISLYRAGLSFLETELCKNSEKNTLW
jgi:hypothetical protein